MWAIVLWLLLWVTSQAIVQVVFKFGSGQPGRAWLYWILANVVGVAGSWILIILYRLMNVNVALGLAFGLSFLVTQVVLALVFRSNISVWQGVGVLFITLGIYLLAAYRPS